MSRRGLAWIVVLALMVTMLGVTARPAAAASWVTGTISTTWGSRSWKLFVPSNYRAGTAVPLVMMLHGCVQDADQFEAGTQMSTVAEANNFLVVYPIQPSSANQNSCWNWFEPAHQARGSGEPAILKALVDDLKSKYTVDSTKVYVAGLSAGGGMSAIMAATYPDVFAAAGVGSGLEYKAATTMNDAFTVMRTGGPDPKTQGKLAYQASGTARRVVPTIVFHGTSDYTVYPVNGDQALSQAMWMNDWADDATNNASINDTPVQSISGQVTSGYAYTRHIYNDSKGKPVGEKWIVNGMGHAWSGGSTNGNYTDPKGPKASQEMWRFFNQFPGTPPVPAGPVISASPTPTTYGGPVNVTLTSNTTGTTIYYTRDGSTPTTASPVYTAPISVTATTTIKAMGVAGGVQGGVSTFAYTISTMAVTVTPAGGTYNDTVNVTMSLNMPGSIYYTTDGTTPTTASPKYTAPFALTCTTCPTTHTVKWLAQDQAGNTGASGSATYTINQPPAKTTTSFYSNATEDGYVYASGQGLPNSTNAYLEMGDTGMNQGQYIIVSFDTSAIPDGAVIDAASITLIHYNNLYFNANGFGPIVADIKSGCFNTNCTLETADFSAAASATGVVTIINIPNQDKQPAYGDVSSAGLAYVNKTGRTQLRIRFQNVTNSNYTLDAIRFYSGSTTDTTLKPVLKVTYH